MRNKQFRREKESPSADMWHTLRVGVFLGILLWVGLAALGALLA
ncbi:hypothetical protein [Shimia sagamensis]|uniref:Uncharacterized protein n=1 Tax=Shimia sagamensis TaxID=1566352 RepID=A0ABY1PGP7_9RHOB|nr:hypothetical protein [Shimia sagamensis]SMP32259.1 hypothetical protein SAMN06265373_108151 [Shimia sagamensis]